MGRVRKAVRVVFKVLGVMLVVLLVALVPLALVVSHDSPCAPAPALPGDATAMKAMVHRCYGSPDVLKLERIEKPVPADDQVLVKVRAAAVNPLDFHYLRGTPYLVRLESGLGAPNNPRLGVDFAGTVEAVGKNVTRFRPGDAVFGGRTGAFAEYVTVREDRAIVPKPANVTFEQAAAVPIAAITALQALRDKGKVRAGQKVLVNGASGGVGTFAVQIAKSYGAEVTGVCSGKNADLVRAIGADHVIDYTREDFTKGAQHYDLIVDMVATHSLLEYARVLNPQGKVVIVGGPSGNWLIGMLGSWIYTRMVSPFVSQESSMMLAEFNQGDMAVLADLLRTGKVKPVIDRTYKLSELPEALKYLELGHARGKVVVSLEDSNEP
ncbi:MAG TPA: NAD(P)-dependent alcohol dehydrogenase [Rudaea sp.]|nr:NAD(P)-dependent alcohol dehydrogenase [Rudaea sp.]